LIWFHTTELNPDFHDLISSHEIRPLLLALVGEALYGIALLCLLLHPVCIYMCIALLDCPLLNYLSKSGSGPNPRPPSDFVLSDWWGLLRLKYGWKVWWKGLKYDMTHPDGLLASFLDVVNSTTILLLGLLFLCHHLSVF
jgi:hypothetical protein